MDLGRLIDTHRAPRSYDDLARDCGGSPSSKRLQQLATQPIKNFPGPDTIAHLARGLRLSHRAVVLAAAESLGLNVAVGEPRVVELMPSGARNLSEEQAGAIAHLVQTIVDNQPEAAGKDDEIFEPIEPTVSEVLRAREQVRLRAVAHGGDQGDEAEVDELAADARKRQTEEQ